MRIVVTGSSGYIGGMIVRRAAKCGHEVIALGRSMHIDPVRPDVVIHAGWHGTRTGRDSSVQLDNIIDTARAVEFAAQAKAKLWIGLGSQAEKNPIDPYGGAKVGAREIAFAMGREQKIKVIWARLFSVYGPHDPGPSLIHDTIAGIRAGKRLTYDSCQQMWDYLYEDDAADTILALTGGAPEGAYDVASAQRVVVKSVVLSLHALMKTKIDPNAFGSSVAAGLPIVVTGPWQTAGVTLFEGLMRTIEGQP